MLIDRSLVLHVANLANLELSDDETVWYEQQMSKVLSHIEELSTMPDELGTEWRGDVLGESTLERPDVAQPSLDPEAALAAAPRRVGTAFQVPRIIE